MSEPRLAWTKSAWEDYVYWQKTDRDTVRRINVLVNDIVRGSSADGIGKPEQLRHDLSGLWSRRINHEHRLVYAVSDDSVIIVSARHHYS